MSFFIVYIKTENNKRPNDQLWLTTHSWSVQGVTVGLVVGQGLTFWIAAGALAGGSKATPYLDTSTGQAAARPGHGAGDRSICHNTNVLLCERERDGRSALRHRRLCGHFSERGKRERGRRNNYIQPLWSINHFWLVYYEESRDGKLHMALLLEKRTQHSEISAWKNYSSLMIFLLFHGWSCDYQQIFYTCAIPPSPAIAPVSKICKKPLDQTIRPALT